MSKRVSHIFNFKLCPCDFTIAVINASSFELDCYRRSGIFSFLLPKVKDKQNRKVFLEANVIIGFV